VDRIDKYNATVNAFITVTVEQALTSAACLQNHVTLGLAARPDVDSRAALTVDLDARAIGERESWPITD
jgi:hypothetical protein